MEEDSSRSADAREALGSGRLAASGADPAFVPAPALGAQYELGFAAGGSFRAVVTEAGAALRHLSLDGVDLVASYPDDVAPPMSAGVVIVPWTGRVRDGRWVHDGRTHQLPLTDHKHRHAVHGLLRFAAYRLVERDGASVTLRAEVFPQYGYPFHLDTRVRYELNDSGLTVTHSIRNIGGAVAPVAVGAHPYLAIGDVPSDELTLSVSASTHLDVDDRMIPTGRTPVADTRWDLRTGALVAELELDDSWGDAVVDGGRSVHALHAPDGRSVRLWADPAFGYVHTFISRIFPDGDDTKTAVAVEPMTAPADALNSGDGLRWLVPGESWSLSWGIQPTGFGSERS